MSDKLNLNTVAESFSSSKRKGFLSPFFKKIIINKFKKINIGYVEFYDLSNKIEIGEPDDQLRASVKIKSDEFYVFLGSGGLLGAAEAYALGYWESSDLVKLIQIMIKNKDLMNSFDSGFARLLIPINKLIHYRRRNSLKGSKKNILAHYDLSNDFYKLWLDETMTYSCGIFESKETSLKDASIEKIDRMCRKLKLNEHDTILEIGTGWGSFSIHAAKMYGCNITTTTISDAQFEYAKQKIKEEGLEDKITLLNTDYRLLKGKYDKIVSIEMIEAVGYKNVPLYFKTVSELLNDQGLFAMQGITYNDQNFDIYKKSVDFINKYIFPGSCLIAISQISDIVKNNTDLIFTDLEDITSHYSITLEKWRNNFMSNKDEIKDLGFSDAFIKMWEFYFVYCEAGFSEKNIGDYQFLFSKSEGIAS